MNEPILVNNNKELAMQTQKSLQNNFLTANALVNDIVLKNYVTKLTELDIVPLAEQEINTNLKNNIRIFKITEMVYQKDEYATFKFETVFNTAQNLECSVFIIVQSTGSKTDFYMGIRSLNTKRTATSLKDTIKKALQGQFPGVKTHDLLNEDSEKLIGSIKADTIASTTCVANNKHEEFINNQAFLQGLDKFALAMQGQSYTAIIVADSVNTQQINAIRNGYETIFTQLSPFANMQLSYGTNESNSISNAFSTGITEGTSHTDNTSETETTSESTSKTAQSTKGKIAGGIAASLTVIGTAVGAVIGAAAGGVGAVPGAMIGGSIFGSIGGGIKDVFGESKSTATSDSRAKTTGESDSTSESKTETQTKTEGDTKGTSENIQLTRQNKSIISTLERIDIQLKRLQECESLGMWECAAYFLSDNLQTTEMAASNYKALMKGENSGVELSAINCWTDKSQGKVDILKSYITNFIHPQFAYNSGAISIQVSPCALVSGNELAIHMGLPRKSVAGFPVIEHADFGKDVVRYGITENSASKIKLGALFNMGSNTQTEVKLDTQSLTMHTFVTGSTGSGKSNTIYCLLKNLCLSYSDSIHFLIIEPAKGEYKNVFGNRKDVAVFGTNPDYTQLLKINPFKFPPKVHVLEHIDRLIEIFNVCWAMYAAMPAILKDAVLSAYTQSGWDVETSTNLYSSEMFPTFADLQDEILNVIENSAYSQELKSNYIGSLATRIKSLTNGLNGQIFSANEIDNTQLFDKNTIVDLSRVGSLETKSLIMGILILRLNEHRMSYSDGMNLPLKHITVLEEAHNILKRTSTEQNPESSNMAGKSVELLANSIAEMRTYGEGFIIADQSPNAVDISAIRNTNTKIIMRLPDEADRRLAGKASALNDLQLEEIAKLPKGVAVVYQNDWVEPILCKVDKFDGEEKLFQKKEITTNISNEKALQTKILTIIMSKKLPENIENFVIDVVKSSIKSSVKCKLFDYLQVLKENKTDNAKLASLAYNFFDGKKALEKLSNSQDFEIQRQIVVKTITDALSIYYDISSLQDNTINTLSLLMVYEYSKILPEQRRFCDNFIEYLEKGV